MHPEDRRRIRDLGERTSATGSPEQVTYRVVHPDGAVLHIRAWTDVRLNPSGAVTHLWGTAMDISPQQEYAARLRANEEHFRVAFDMAPIGMSMISLSPAARRPVPAHQRGVPADGRPHRGRAAGADHR